MEYRMNHLLCFGFGFSARTLAARLKPQGWKISATSREASGLDIIAATGANGFMFNAEFNIPADVTHILLSAPPDENGDPVLRLFRNQLIAARNFNWIGYLSTTGVYGDRGGNWVDEDSPLAPGTRRGELRLAAERQWLELHQQYGFPLHVFRLAGIYGPGRNQLESLRKGTAKRVIKPGQVFSRIHVEDIAGVLEASISAPNPGRIYNVCDDEPAPPEDVVEFAAGLEGVPVPPAVPFEAAALSPMAKSFYADSKRVSNQRIKTELGYQLQYPTFREGLRALQSKPIA
jgi:nucleoside-diphosphate-sugar epimerase